MHPRAVLLGSGIPRRGHFLCGRRNGNRHHTSLLLHRLRRAQRDTDVCSPFAHGHINLSHETDGGGRGSTGCTETAENEPVNTNKCHSAQMSPPQTHLRLLPRGERERRCEYLQLPRFRDRVGNGGGDVEIVLYRELGPIRFLLQRLDVTMKEEAMVGSVQPTDVEPSGGCCCGVVLNLDLKFVQQQID